jgi:hypothetical protein
MAIYGAGSNWDGKEMKNVFFKENKFTLGWNDNNAKDLYNIIGTLKIGDILYLKSNAPGSRKIRVKGIGIVTHNFIDCLVNGDFTDMDINDWESLFVKVNWKLKEEFIVEIPANEGKLTNVRAASFYEEFLPLVQRKIIEKLM